MKTLKEIKTQVNSMTKEQRNMVNQLENKILDKLDWVDPYEENEKYRLYELDLDYITVWVAEEIEGDPEEYRADFTFAIF